MLPLLPLLLPLLLLTLLPPAPERPGTTTAEANPPTRLATENIKRRGRGLNARKIYSTTPPCPPPPATKSITLSTNARTTTPRKKRAAWQASRARIPAYASRVTPYAAAQRRRRRMPPSRAPTHAATAPHCAPRCHAHRAGECRARLPYNDTRTHFPSADAGGIAIRSNQSFAARRRLAGTVCRILVRASTLFPTCRDLQVRAPGAREEEVHRVSSLDG